MTQEIAGRKTAGIRDLLRPPYYRMSRWLFYRLQFVRDREAQRDIENLLSKLKACGSRPSLDPPIRLFAPECVSLGSNVHIGENAFIRGEGGLYIGDNTRISRNLVLYTMNHRYQGDRLPYDDGRVMKPVYIGKNVWIGMNVCIAPGTRIGDGVIVGMGTTVSGEIPELSIIGSPPWRLLGRRNPEHYARLENEGSYADPYGRPLD